VNSAAAQPLHVVILAAGRGSRLGALGEETPKWLLEIGGRTLAERHLEGIGLAGGAVASTRVVTGHAGAAIEAFLAGRPEPVGVVRNPAFLERNNWFSLLLALRELPAGAPVAVLNADLLADPAQVAAFLHDAASGTAEGLLAVDLERHLTDESMKVERDAGGCVTRIGKVGLDAPEGEYIGLLAMRGAVRDALEAKLETFDLDPAADDEWYEGALGRTAAEGSCWEVWPMPAGGWVEIDDDADLDLARSIAVMA
jgi:choline kinase